MKYTHSDNNLNERTFSSEDFLSPSARFYPALAWAWGTPINKEEIVRQLDAFAGCKVEKLYIIPEPKDFRPAYTMEPDYLTEEYFNMFRFAYEYAADKGMELWLYDEGGWPSGSACGRVIKENPALISKRLAAREVSSPYSPSEDAIAAFCGKERVFEGFSSEDTITEYYMEPKSGTYPNISDARTTDAFLRITHDEYKKHIGHMFGKKISAVFTDEPVTERTGWCDGFPEKFSERYGYDILDYLPVIFKEPDEEVTKDEKQIRIDYLDLLAEVFAENFFLKCRNWCNENNMLFTGHLDDEDITYSKKQRFYNILRQMRCFDMPGIDVIWRQIFPGKKNHFFPRFASSAANQTGKPYTISESFAVYGAGLTFNEMRYIVNYQLMRGINTFNFNSVSFSYDGLGRKNARPCFMPLLPTWRHFADFNVYTARMSYLASLGTPSVTHAVYLPHHSLWSGGAEAQNAADGFDSIVYELEKRHCPIDIIDDDFLQTAVLNKNTLCTGTAAYSGIVMQRGVKIPPLSQKKLDEFEKAGGRIIFEDNLNLAESAADISSDNISVFKRNLDGATLFILCNEGVSKETFSVSVKEDGNIYEISALTGEFFVPDLSNINLESGEAVVFLITDKKYCAKPHKKHTNGSIVIDRFLVKRTSAFIIGEKTLEKHTFDESFKEVTPTPWDALFGDDFSGEVTYKIEFGFDTVPESIEIDLGSVNYSCDLTLNGKPLGTLFAPPFTVFVEGDIIKKHNVLTVNVANTHANQYVFTKAFDNISEEAMGPYHPIARQFESESLKSGILNPITIRF